MSAAGVAAEPSPLAAPEYRLNLGSADAYRLNTGSADRLQAPGQNPVAPAAAPRAEATDAAHLADRPFASLIEAAAREAAIDPALVHAVISVESGYNAAARSPKGAIGLMQLMPETALRYGVRNAVLFAPEDNLRAGTRYLSDLMALFDNRIELVLAAYNAGENAVLRFGQSIPPFRETQHYVPAVLTRYLEWREPPPPVAPVPRRIQYMPGTVLDPAFAQAARR